MIFFRYLKSVQIEDRDVKENRKNINKLIQVTKNYLKGSLNKYLFSIKSGEIDKANRINEMILYYRQIVALMECMINHNVTSQGLKKVKDIKPSLKHKKLRKLRKLKVDKRKQVKNSNTNTLKKVKEKFIKSELEGKRKKKKKKPKMEEDLEDKIVSREPREQNIILKWDSYHLNDLSEYINGKPPEERIGYIAGFRDDGKNSYIPVEIFDLELAVTTPVGATPKPESVSNILNYLSDTGHVLNGIVHRHYGKGPSATYPSSVDLETLKNLQIYSPVVSIIFSEDNYFRIVQGKQKIENRIYGKGIKKVGDNNEDVYCFC